MSGQRAKGRGKLARQAIVGGQASIAATRRPHPSGVDSGHPKRKRIRTSAAKGKVKGKGQGKGNTSKEEDNIHTGEYLSEGEGEDEAIEEPPLFSTLYVNVLEDKLPLPGHCEQLLLVYKGMLTGCALLASRAIPFTLEGLQPIVKHIAKTELTIPVLEQVKTVMWDTLQVAEKQTVTVEDGSIDYKVSIDFTQSNGKRIANIKSKLAHYAPTKIAERCDEFRARLVAYCKTYCQALLDLQQPRPPGPVILKAWPSEFDLENVPPVPRANLALSRLNAETENERAGLWKAGDAVPQPLSVVEFIDFVKAHPMYRNQIRHIHETPSREAEYAELKHPLNMEVVNALKSNGITTLFKHQVDAIDGVFSGRDVIIATSTSSGKSLCYQIPILQAVSSDSDARCLYISPTKALAQDQHRSLNDLFPSTTGTNLLFSTYDGDTPKEVRRDIRDEAQVILSNPDMLHVAVLPYHQLWAEFLKNLKYVIIDEAHAYRGIFGSHVALVFRRLLRMCEFYGSSPQFILCSATIANPREHCLQLTCRDPLVINHDTSPCGTRRWLLWNPPALAEGDGKRTSPYVEATNLFVEMITHNLRTLAFGKVRTIAELILTYARERLSKENPDLLPLIKCYRGGYRADERRLIEQQLFRGHLLGVTATTALELGVDIGTLDSVIVCGYPGTVASLWQQAGRAGRGTRDALIVLVGLLSPMDQYIMKHGEEFFKLPPEAAVIDACNPYIVRLHLQCAVQELALNVEQEKALWSGVAEPLLQRMEGDNYNVTLDKNLGLWVPRRDRSPLALDFSIRCISQERFSVIKAGTGEVVEEMEGSLAYQRIHEGAVYMYQGQKFLVTKFDLAKRCATIQRARVRYHTKSKESYTIRLVATIRMRSLNASKETPQPRVPFYQTEMSKPVSERGKETTTTTTTPTTTTPTTTTTTTTTTSTTGGADGGVTGATRATSATFAADLPFVPFAPREDTSHLLRQDRPGTTKTTTTTTTTTTAATATTTATTDSGSTTTADATAATSTTTGTDSGTTASVTARPGERVWDDEENQRLAREAARRASRRAEIAGIPKSEGRREGEREGEYVPVVDVDPALLAGKGAFYHHAVQNPGTEAEPPSTSASSVIISDHNQRSNVHHPNYTPVAKLKTGSRASLRPLPVTPQRKQKVLGSGRGAVAEPNRATTVSYGYVNSRVHVYGFTKIWTLSGQTIEVLPLDMPHSDFSSTGFWITLSPGIKQACENAGLDYFRGIHTVKHMLVNLLPLFIMCDPWDLAGIARVVHNDTHHSEIVVFDMYPGGVGITEAGYHIVDSLVQECFRVARECDCKDGCIACMHCPRCDCYNELVDKKACLFIIRQLAEDMLYTSEMEKQDRYVQESQAQYEEVQGVGSVSRGHIPLMG